jgi:hypothetical protein
MPLSADMPAPVMTTILPAAESRATMEARVEELGWLM